MANFIGNAKWSKKDVRRGERMRSRIKVSFFAPTFRLTKIFQKVLASQSKVLFTHIQTFGSDPAQAKKIPYKETLPCQKTCRVKSKFKRGRSSDKSATNRFL